MGGGTKKSSTTKILFKKNLLKNLYSPCECAYILKIQQRMGRTKQDRSLRSDK
jgi:hypothetical protein